MNWAFGPIRGYQPIQGRLNKVIMRMVQEEEIKIVCGSPKYVQGENSSRKRRSEVSKNILSSSASLKIASQLRVGHWIRDE